MKSNAWTEKFMRGVFFIAACASVLAVALICVFLFANGVPAMSEIGFLDFLTGTMWKPNNDIYGILPMIVGSLYVTAGAIIIGVPIGILTAVFMALGIAATCFSGCGLTEGNGGTSASEPTKAAATAAPKDTATPTPKATAAPKPTKAAAQTGSGSQSGNTGNTSSEAEKEITYINGVLTDSDEDSVTIEYGSDGDFNQTTFDISNADIQIGENKKQGGPLAANLNLKIGYYVENGDYIAVSVYGDGSESMTPSWVYNYEMKSVSGNVRYNDDSTMTIETGSDGDFYEMTFDISSAELDIQVDEVIGVSGLRTSLNVDVNYYVKDGVNIATYVYSDGTEYFSPSQLYNMEQRNTQAEEDTQEYEESGDADYIDEEEETSEDY